MISVGIDVSKGKSMVCIMKPGGEVLKTPFEIRHTMSELEDLVSLIKSYPEEVRVIVEDTGHYHWPIVEQLTNSGIFVSSVNALRMKKYCSQSIRKAKTDRIDSIHIASYGITYWSELISFQPAERTYKELKMLSRQFYQSTNMYVKAKVSLNTLLDQAMPDIFHIMSNNGTNHKLTDFVARYWHYGHILEMGKSRFRTDYCKWAKKQGYREYERLANEIFSMAQSGIPVLPNSPVTKVIVTEAVRVLHQIEASRNTILSQMIELAKSLPEFSVIRAMPRIGDNLASRFIAEIGDIRRFHNKHSLIAYAGIDAPPYQSGTFNATERHISKRGNSHLRKIGYEIMQSLLKHPPTGDPVYEFIVKKRSEGKCAHEAMIAGLNKFLRIYYGRITELYSTLQIA